jgi:hypothetical protein
VNAPEWDALKSYAAGLERKPEVLAPSRPSPPPAVEAPAPARPETGMHHSAEPERPVEEKGPKEENEKTRKVPIDLDEILKDLES